MNFPPSTIPTATEAHQQDDFSNDPTAVEIGSSIKSKLFGSAILANAERDELLVEIFTYFKWLEQNLASSPDGGQLASDAGVSITGVSQVLMSLEFAFKVVRDKVLVLNRLVEGMAKHGEAPFLERYCEGEFKKKRDQVKLTSNPKTWEERYADLIQYKAIINDCSPQELNKCSEGLGDWLQSQRHLYAQQDADFMKVR